MTPEAQRIAIHAAQGWQKYDGKQEVECMWAPGHISSVVPEWFRVVNGCIEFSIQAPIYENDLNAMHEAEKYAGEHLMDADQWEEYGHALERIHPHACLKTPNEEKVDYYDFATLMVELTAAQRAEAFLRTLGLWKDEA